MRTYHYSALLVACGMIYSFLNPAGNSSTTGKGETEKEQANAKIVQTQKSENATEATAPPNGYPQELCVQFAEKCTPADPDSGTVVPGLRRDDINDPQFVIATVPDPATTHLRVEFDRAVAGIKDAAADEKFLFRRFWLPWPIEAAQQFSDRPSQEKEEQQRALKRKYPGFLLFENGEHKSLIVLLVGENPADGIHRQQFRNAISMKKWIETHPAPAQVSTPSLYIAGTSFSGSLETLRLALKESEETNFEVISGTVSDAASIKSFGNLKTLSHSSTTALTALRNYVRRTWGYEKDIAILSETETAFGALGDIKSGFFKIPFPRDIAHLRNAYQSYPGLSGFGVMSPGALQSKNLPLPLDDSRNTVDTIPDFAAQSVVSQETMIAQIVNRIRHEHVQFAGIIGTDVLDVLFITNFVRAASPDTRLFVLDPDLLFVHAADSLPFEGVLAITTYPLLDGNPPFVDDGTPRSDAHWIFPGAFQQGFHNALRVLLARVLKHPLQPLPGYEPVTMGDKEPALWISSVGRESFVPIAAFQPASRNPALVDLPEKTRPLSAVVHEPTRIWWFLFLLATLAMASLSFVVHRAQHSSEVWLSDFRIQPDDGYSRHLGFLLIFAAGIYLLILSTGTRLLFSPSAYPRSSIALLLSVTIIGLASIAIQLVLCAKWARLGRLSLGMLGVTAVTVTAIFVLFLFLTFKSEDLAGVFFAFRSFELSAGASPSVPFLMLFCGFLVWSFVNLQRSVFHHQRRQRLPRAKSDEILGRNIYPRADWLIENLQRPLRRSRNISVPLGAGAFLLSWVILADIHLRSLEGVAYDRFFTAMASALVAALVVVCGHFVRSWGLLASVLEQLEMHPLRMALTALPPDRSWSPIWQSNPRKRNYLVVSRSIDVLLALRTTGLVSPGLERQINTASECVGKIRTVIARGMRETDSEHITCQDALLEVAETLITDLQDTWHRGNSQIMKDRDDATEGMKTGAAIPRSAQEEMLPVTLAEEFVALRYLAFIRYAMLQLRNMLTFLTVGFLAFAFAMMSYPFQSERLIAWLITALFLVISAMVLFVFAQMQTDPTLKRITNREGAKSGLDFFSRALAFGALPLLAVLASNFNGVGRLLFSWIEPALKTMH